MYFEIVVYVLLSYLVSLMITEVCMYLTIISLQCTH